MKVIVLATTQCKWIKENDEARASYFRHHFKVDWLDCTLYNLAIDTGRIPRDMAVELIEKTAKGLF